MKVILFNINWLNPKQAIIGLFTWSGDCHSGLLFDTVEDQYKNILFDASESRGNVNWQRNKDKSLKSIQEFKNQRIRVYEIPENENINNTSSISPKQYALNMIGLPYDWKGIAGWLPFFGSNNARTVYCFELVLQTLLQFPSINNIPVSRLDMGLREKLFKKPIDSEDIELVFARAGLNPIYEGKAKNYLGF